MKKNRVDCANCTEFKFPEYGIKSIKIVTKAKCKLGKRVVFRVNGLHPDSSDWECGWFRYCDEFNDKINEK
jgi:hypothetical protein